MKRSLRIAAIFRGSIVLVFPNRRERRASIEKKKEKILIRNELDGYRSSTGSGRIHIFSTKKRDTVGAFSGRVRALRAIIKVDKG